MGTEEQVERRRLQVRSRAAVPSLWDVCLLIGGGAVCTCACMLSGVLPSGMPWAVTRQAPLSMALSWQRILEWLAMPSSRGSSDPGIKPTSPALAGGYPGKPR